MRSGKILFVLAAVCLGIMSRPAVAGLVIYLPENATYHYVNATAATTVGGVPANWYAIAFNDSTWFTGQGAFGTSFGGSVGNTTGPQTPDSPTYTGATAWSANYDPYVRTTFVLPAPTALTLWLAVDNGINGAFLNGVQATAAVNAEGTANRWEHVFDIPADYTYAGTNTLALQLEDHGGGTGFALVITANDTATHPVFSSNPPPPPITVPLPSALGMAIAGGGLLAFRRRCLR